MLASRIHLLPKPKSTSRIIIELLLLNADQLVDRIFMKVKGLVKAPRKYVCIKVQARY